eukprot:m.271870 g.271870  ORF g.271870 m.271870 type:complete len:1515 (-) comp17673_c0_seq18:2871-7415(-)
METKATKLKGTGSSMFSRLFSSSKLEAVPSPDKDSRRSSHVSNADMPPVEDRDFVKDERTYRKTGTLHKKIMNKAWVERFVVVQEDWLYDFESAAMEEVMDQVYLPTANLKSNAEKCKFVLECSDPESHKTILKSYRAATSEGLADWITHVHVVQGQPDLPAERTRYQGSKRAKIKKRIFGGTRRERNTPLEALSVDAERQRLHYERLVSNIVSTLMEVRTQLESRERALPSAVSLVAHLSQFLRLFAMSQEDEKALGAESIGVLRNIQTTMCQSVSGILQDVIDLQPLTVTPDQYSNPTLAALSKLTTTADTILHSLEQTSSHLYPSVPVYRPTTLAQAPSRSAFSLMRSTSSATLATHVETSPRSHSPAHMLSNNASALPSRNASRPITPTFEPDATKLDQLQRFGFDQTEASAALTNNGNDLLKALHSLKHSRVSQNMAEVTPLERNTSSVFLRRRATSTHSLNLSHSDSRDGLLQPKGRKARSASHRAHPTDSARSLGPSPTRKTSVSSAGAFVDRMVRNRLSAGSGINESMDSQGSSSVRISVAEPTPHEEDGEHADSSQGAASPSSVPRRVSSGRTNSAENRKVQVVDGEDIAAAAAAIKSEHDDDDDNDDNSVEVADTEEDGDDAWIDSSRASGQLPEPSDPDDLSSSEGESADEFDHRRLERTDPDEDDDARLEWAAAGVRFRRKPKEEGFKRRLSVMGMSERVQLQLDNARRQTSGPRTRQSVTEHLFATTNPFADVNLRQTDAQDRASALALMQDHDDDDDRESRRSSGSSRGRTLSSTNPFALSRSGTPSAQASPMLARSDRLATTNPFADAMVAEAPEDIAEVLVPSPTDTSPPKGRQRLSSGTSLQQTTIVEEVSSAPPPLPPRSASCDPPALPTRSGRIGHPHSKSSADLQLDICAALRTGHDRSRANTDTQLRSRSGPGSPNPGRQLRGPSPPTGAGLALDLSMRPRSKLVLEGFGGGQNQDASTDDMLAESQAVTSSASPKLKRSLALDEPTSEESSTDHVRVDSNAVDHAKAANITQDNHDDKHDQGDKSAASRPPSEEARKPKDSLFQLEAGDSVDPATQVVCLRVRLNEEESVVKVKAGTLEQLIEYLLHPANHDETFLETLELCYPVFTQSQVLFLMLLQRHDAIFTSLKELRQEGSGANEEALTKVAISHTYCCNALARLLPTLLLDADVQLAGQVHTLVASLLELTDIHFVSLANSLAEALDKALLARQAHRAEKLRRASTGVVRIMAEPDLLSAQSTSTKYNTIADVSATDIAQELTLLDWDLFAKVTAPELLAWRKVQSAETSPNVWASIAHFNRVSCWAATLLCLESSLSRRAKLLKRLINVMQHLKKRHNFSSMLAILSGINNAAVYRLHFTFDKVGERYNNHLKKLNKLMSTERNSSLQRTAMAQSELPLIPYLGLFLSDLTMAHNGNPDYLKMADGRKLINFAKMQRFHSICSTIQHYQSMKYPFPSRPEVRQLFNDFSQSMTDEDLYDLSLKLEPRNATIDQIMS